MTEKLMLFVMNFYGEKRSYGVLTAQRWLLLAVRGCWMLVQISN